jgi:glycosyltransferase involved in cell wall biosynthesis
MKKVCHITTVHSLNDDRIFYKECKSLKKEGYNVFFIVKNQGDKSIEGINIIGLKNYHSRIQRIIFGSIEAFRKALKTNSDLYHFHDPELIIVGILLKILGKKVIYDIHEDVPAQILNKNWLGSKTIRKLVSFIINIFEHLGVSIFDGIITVTPDISKRFNKKMKVTIRNLPILKLIDQYKPINIIKEKQIVIYSGALTKIRGIKEIITAMENLGEKAELWLLGEWEDNKYRNECEKLSGWNYCKYFGLIPFGEHYKYIKISDIGLVNFLPFPNHETALPNKPFEYMACSIPVIMSNFAFWQKIFKNNAIFVDPNNSKEISYAINELLENPKRREKLGKNGKELIKNELSWEKEEIKLLEFYKNIIKNGNPSN